VVADNVSAGGYLGPVTRRPSEVEDLGLIGCVVRVAGEV
jgi:2-oxo-3-hexenedioate decarboxylase